MRQPYSKHSELMIEVDRGRVARSLLLGAGLMLSVCFHLPAQSQPPLAPAVRQPVEKGIPFPPSEPLQQVRQDATALTVVRSYQHAVGKANWVDLEATGTMIPEVLRSQGTLVQQDATLHILGHRGYRLDVETSKGTISIRMDGANGAMRPPGVRVIPMDPRDAASGLLAFPQLQDPSFPAKDVSLIDQGTVLVDGIRLHRITAEVPWSSLAVDEQKQSGVCITDLYFDPENGLLAKSVNLLQGTDPRLARYIKVVTYGDYRPLDGVQIPFLISESLNRKQVWTLQLNHLQFSTGLKETFFSF